MRQALPPVLLPRRHPQPRGAGDAGLDPRGRRARLLPRPRVRRRLRQPRSAGLLRRRRRRSRDGPAGRELALQQVPRPGPRRRRAADPAPERLQDRQPHGAGADPRATSCAASSRATATTPTSSRATSPRPCTSGWPPSLDEVVEEIHDIQRAARRGRRRGAPALADDRLRTPKGWTGPKEVDGLPVEGTFRAHQVPIARGSRRTPSTSPCSSRGCGATGPRSCSTRTGALVPELAELAPKGRRRMSANPHANGGPPAARPLPARLPRLRGRGAEARHDDAEATRVLGRFLRDVIREQPRQLPPLRARRDRLEPSWTPSSRPPTAPSTREILPDGRPPRSRRPGHGGPVRAPLPGLARGLPAHRPARPVQLLRGVHPHRRLDVQPARQVAQGLERDIPWRAPIASLNYLLSSHVWRQDHNGFSHQDPGFIDHVVNKKAEIIRVYLPPDANTLLSVADHCLRSRDYVNVIVAGKQPQLSGCPWRRRSCTARAGSAIWDWASNDQGRRARRRDRLRRRRSHARGTRGRSTWSASTCPISRCGS